MAFTNDKQQKKAPGDDLMKINPENAQYKLHTTAAEREKNRLKQIEMDRKLDRTNLAK
jgi:hypothetical protein